MTRKNSNRTTSEIKAMMAEDGDFLRPIVRTVIEEFLEAEMTETSGFFILPYKCPFKKPPLSLPFRRIKRPYRAS